MSRHAPLGTPSCILMFPPDISWSCQLAVLCVVCRDLLPVSCDPSGCVDEVVPICRLHSAFGQIWRRDLFVAINIAICSVCLGCQDTAHHKQRHRPGSKTRAGSR